MHIAATENASGFSFAVFTYVADSVTSEAYFNFGYKWEDFIVITGGLR